MVMLMRYILYGIGTLLAVLFMIRMKQGEKYEALIANLSETEYPMHELYGVGFAWNNSKLFHLKGRTADYLKQNVMLIYEPQYAEFYANIIWAETLTLVHLTLTCTLLCCSILYDNILMIGGGGIFITVLLAVYSMTNVKNMVSERTEKCTEQLPEIVSTMAILVNSGMVLRDAWKMIGESGDSEFQMLMRKATERMNNGSADIDAIFLFGKETNSPEVTKFVSALIQSIEKGGGELPVFLINQSNELWGLKKQTMIQKGEQAATKLLAPIMLIFIGVIIMVMTAAFAGSLF